MSLRLPSNRLVIACSLVTLWICSNVSAADDKDAARQLLQLNGLDNILRNDAEQAGLISDRLPEDLPAELRSDLRRAIDANLDYTKMETALLHSISSKIDAASLDQSARWWASSSGREIAKAESSIHAALLDDSTFETYNPTAQAIDTSNAKLVEEIVATGKFPEFLRSLVLATEESQLCLLSNLDDSSEPDCAQKKADLHNNLDQLTRNIMQVATSKYLKVSAGDLQAYLAFLRSNKVLATMDIFRTAEVEVEKQGWQKTEQQLNAAVDGYAKAHFSHLNEAALSKTITDIDNLRNLSRARFTLYLMSRAGPPNATVFVQLARVALKQARDLTDDDNAPSVPRIDEGSLETARQYIDQAISLEPNRADAVRISGHIAYLQGQFQKSIERFEKAKALGEGVNPWLHVYLGDALWASAMQPPGVNRPLAQRAADELEAALKLPPRDGVKDRAAHQLGAIYAELGDIPKADSYHRQYISMQDGRNKAFALHRYALFLLFYAKDNDRALAAAREAVQTDSFPLGHMFLVEMLTIKGGELVSSGRAKEAVTFLDEARKMQPDLESLCPELARFPRMFPGVIGIHSSGAIKHFSGRIGGQTLVRASIHATSKQIEELLSWGASPNYLDPDEGTPLHVAILADNVEAVRTLLAHGANPSTPFIDGRLPADLQGAEGDTRREEALALVRKAGGRRGAAAAGGPFKMGYEYQLKRNLDGTVNGRTWADPLSAGEHLIYGGECRYTDSAVACFYFKKLADHGNDRRIAIAKDQLVSWTDWFREIGPERGAPSKK